MSAKRPVLTPLAALVAACLLAAPRASAADGTPTYVSVGYGFCRITNGNGFNLPLGIAVSAASPVSGPLWVAVDARWNHRDLDDVVGLIFDSARDERDLLLHGGLVFRL